MAEEEETEAMASQFSSLVVVDDIFSKLPEHIIHCVLGFLRTKDVVRTSAISKSWLQAWRTFPIPIFNALDFEPPFIGMVPYELDEAKSKQFIEFVDSTLQRFKRQIGDGNGNKMKIFYLSTIRKMAHHHSTRWIGMALDNQVEHLTLSTFWDDSGLSILIPDRVLSAYWLKSLNLEGCSIYIQFNDGSRVNLPLLTSLYIEHADIPNQQLQKLLSGCPALENIALLECELLSKVDIFQHPNLETVKFTVSNNTGSDHVAIRVSAPKLKSFDYTCYEECECDVVVKIHNSPELKSLKISDKHKTDEWFHKFIAQFPLFEDLTIEGCEALRKIRISNPLLAKIIIMDCNSLKDVVISSKKLASFSLFTPYSSILTLSIRMEMDNLPNDCKVHIRGHDPYSVRRDLLMEANWYCNMKEFLTRHTFKSVTVDVDCVEDGDMTGKDLHKKLPSTAYKIEKLSLIFRAPSWCLPHILDGLLSACHPTTIKLDVIYKASVKFVRLVCEELEDWEDNINCFCKDDFKCWKHQLKEVKIEKIKGIKLEDGLDWDALFELLPTLKKGNDISFKLIW